VDPNLFHIDGARVFEALVTIVVLAFILERALALIFESRYYIGKFEENNIHIKELVALALGIVVCELWNFDAISMILLKERTTWYGAAITGAVIAGGSKASLALFRDVMHFMSNAEEERQKKRKKRLVEEGLISEESKGGK
jgi:hypothetical protein